jgi:hypothetical protein
MKEEKRGEGNAKEDGRLGGVAWAVKDAGRMLGFPRTSIKDRIGI